MVRFGRLSIPAYWGEFEHRISLALLVVLVGMLLFRICAFGRLPFFVQVGPAIPKVVCGANDLLPQHERRRGVHVLWLYRRNAHDLPELLRAGRLLVPPAALRESRRQQYLGEWPHSQSECNSVSGKKWTSNGRREQANSRTWVPAFPLPVTCPAAHFLFVIKGS